MREVDFCPLDWKCCTYIWLPKTGLSLTSPCATIPVCRVYRHPTTFNIIHEATSLVQEDMIYWVCVVVAYRDQNWHSSNTTVLAGYHMHSITHVDLLIFPMPSASHPQASKPSSPRWQTRPLSCPQSIQPRSSPHIFQPDQPRH